MKPRLILSLLWLCSGTFTSKLYHIMSSLLHSYRSKPWFDIPETVDLRFGWRKKHQNHPLPPLHIWGKKHEQKHDKTPAAVPWNTKNDPAEALSPVSSYAKAPRETVFSIWRCRVPCSDAIGMPWSELKVVLPLGLSRINRPEVVSHLRARSVSYRFW